MILHPFRPPPSLMHSILLLTATLNYSSIIAQAFTSPASSSSTSCSCGDGSPSLSLSHVRHTSHYRHRVGALALTALQSNDTPTPEHDGNRKLRVVIIGSGVGGLATAARLASTVGDDVDVVVLEKNPREQLGKIQCR